MTGKIFPIMRPHYNPGSFNVYFTITGDRNVVHSTDEFVIII